MNVLIVGVGGQGTLLAAKVLGAYASLMQYECKLSEVHGMSQRGGSVVTHVRFGQQIFSPVIWEGGADVVLAFEPLEAMRYAHFLKEDGVIVTNTAPIPPLAVTTGKAQYPDIQTGLAGAVAVDATALAQQAGSVKCVNMVMLGVLTKAMHLDYEVMQKAVENSVKKLLELNLTALRLGYESK